MESNDEKVEEEKPPLPEPYVFDLPSHPYQMDIRVKVEAKVHQESRYSGLCRLHEFLLRIDDYDLVRQVCQIEERDYENKGIGNLVRLPHVPQYYDHTLDEEYQSFLSHIEKLMAMHLGGRKTNLPLYPFFRDEQYKHPYSLLIYALALIPLGRHAQYIGRSFLSHAQTLEHNCPGFIYALEAYCEADMLSRYFKEEE